VVTGLLADLVARGLRYNHGILAVLDGSKALRKAVAKARTSVVRQLVWREVEAVLGCLIAEQVQLAIASGHDAEGARVVELLISTAQLERESEAVTEAHVDKPRLVSVRP